MEGVTGWTGPGVSGKSPGEHKRAKTPRSSLGPTRGCFTSPSFGEVLVWESVISLNTRRGMKSLISSPDPKKAPSFQAPTLVPSQGSRDTAT